MILPSPSAESKKIMDESARDFKWLFHEEKLRDTPSNRQGISPEKELIFRQKEAMLIQAIGSKAHLTQLAVKTSVVIMHRFFMYRSITYYPRIQVAVAFALAGGKVEESESARKLEHLIRSTIDVLFANKNREFMDKLDPISFEMDTQIKPKITALKQNKCNIDSVEYMELRKLILECETEIYAVIGFQLQIVHPHNFVLRMSQLLGAENIKDITQYAYNLATASSQLTMLCLKYRPETIATMCLNVALKANDAQLKSLKDPELKWYQTFDKGTDFSEIEAVSEEFLQLLKTCNLLSTWMSMLTRIGKRAPIRPGTYPPSRHQQIPAGKVAGSGSGQTQSNRHVNAAQADPSLHQRSQSGNKPMPSRPTSQSQGQRTSSSTSSSTSQPQHGDPHSKTGLTSGSSRPSQPPPPTSSSSSSSRLTQSSRPAVPNDPSRSREMSQSGGGNDGQAGRNKLSQEAYKSRDPSFGNGRKSKSWESQKHRSSYVVESESPPRQSSSSSAVYSPVPVRPPSPPFPPPEDMEVDEENPDSYEDRNNSQTNLLASAAAPSSKLTLSDYRQRASARVKEDKVASHSESASSLPHSDSIGYESIKPELLSDDSQFGSKDKDARHERIDQSPVADNKDRLMETGSAAPYISSVPSSVLSSETQSNTTLLDSPSKHKLKIKKRPGEQYAVECADSLGIRIKIRPPKPSKMESEGSSIDVPSGERTGLLSSSSGGFNYSREEGEVLEDAPSPARSTGSGRKSEGLKIRLSVPKSTDSSSGGGDRKRDSANSWHNGRSDSNQEGEDRDMGWERSHHHHHHQHRHQHKSKKSKEYRSGKHHSKLHTSHSMRSLSSSSSYGHKRSSSISQDQMPSGAHHQYDGHQQNNSSEFGVVDPLPPPPPPLPPLQHQMSGFSINDAFSSSLALPSLGSVEEDYNQPPPSTPVEDFPPHHKKFHRLMQEYKNKTSRPPPPPVAPPPPPPPGFPPPPPPPPE